ncbi:hypothetical protein NMY22_g13300 [Coprinellus aureogranulatus]|nr:hypothetical protein NMY22_g13300 [Coprinellus aureogranulatus]
MRLSSIIPAAVLFATSLFANAKPVVPFSPRGCGNAITEQAKALLEQDFQQSLNRSGLASSSAATGYPRTLNVFFHVITANTTTQGGSVTDQQITQQMMVLNEAYRNTGIQFRLQGTNRIENIGYFNTAGPNSRTQKEMKQNLRQGGAADLNVYTVGFTTNPGLLGYATFPANYRTNPKDDGVVLLYSTLPGGSTTNYNLGHTLTHEVGIWDTAWAMSSSDGFSSTDLTRRALRHSGMSASSAPVANIVFGD